MITNDEIIQWAKIAESLNGETGMAAYTLFDKISQAYKEDENIISRLKDLMGNHTSLNQTQIKSFVDAAEQYCWKYS